MKNLSTGTGLNHAVRVTVAAMSIVLGLGAAEPAAAQCPGDIIPTGNVNGNDLGELLATWGTNGQGVVETDLNGDGIVNGADLGIVLSGWGPCSPVISSILPNTGPVGGGTPITITGNYFNGPATVTLGGVPATNVQVVNATTITAETPALAAGSVDVVVTINGRSGSLADGFTFQHPLISSIVPNTGPVVGGTAIAITGNGWFSGPATVTLGGVPATNVQVSSATRVTAVTPAVPAGNVDVVVTVGGRTVTVTNGFTFNSVSGTVRQWGYLFNVPADLGPCTAIAGGWAHTIALRTDGTARAWGENIHGQCNIPSDLGPCTAVAGGESFTLALRDDGVVRAWGINSHGQCNVPTDLGPCTAIAGGGFHTIALRTDGTVRAWGAGTTNTGGPYNHGQSIIPTDLGPCTAIAGGGFHTIALRTDGTVRAWGAGTSNTDGPYNFGQSIVPTDLGPCTAIAAGGYHTIALRTDGTVRAWGAGTTNTGSSLNRGQSIIPTDLGPCTAIAAGGYHTIALRTDGTVRAWGAGTTISGGQFDRGQSVVPMYLGPCTTIAAGGYHTIVIQR